MILSPKLIRNLGSAGLLAAGLLAAPHQEASASALLPMGDSSADASLDISASGHSSGALDVLSGVLETSLTEPAPLQGVAPVRLRLHAARIGLASDSAVVSDPALEPLRSKDDDEIFSENTEYRYDFGDRHLTWGLTASGGLTRGVVINAFPYDYNVSPFFRFGFGDGNTLQLDITTMLSPFWPSQYGWFFFRTPIMGGDAVGSLYMVAPTLSFRYEMDMSATISKKSPFMAVGGLGLGVGYVWGYVNLSNNGTVGTGSSQTLINEIMLDAVPMVGVKYRLGEFAALEVGGKMHMLFPLLYNNTSGPGTKGWLFGRPYAVPEGWIDASRLMDVYLSFSYDFG